MVFARARRAPRRASRASPPVRDARRPTTCTLLAFLLFCPSPARGQFGPFGSEGSGAATCDIDISTVRLDPTLGEMCDPAKQGDGLCEACICDMSDRILEAGYAVTGPEAISFETCAFEHLATLQRRGGITLTGMMTVASRCSDIPACLAELEAKHGMAGDAAATDKGVSTTDPDALARAAAGPASGDPDVAADGAAVDPEDAPEGSKAQELLAAVADVRTTSAATAAPAPGDVVLGDTIAAVGAGADGGGGNVAAAVVPSAAAALVLALTVWYLHRERRRAYMAAAHADAVEESALAGAKRLVFEDITCAATPPPRFRSLTEKVGRRRRREKEGEKEGSAPVDGEPSTGSIPRGDSERFEERVLPSGRVLLDSVSGSCARGEMLAIMGPSGAGKSTLLDVLAGRTDPRATGVARVAGAVTLDADGVPLDAAALSARVAYVPQDDTHLLQYLTVMETVVYSAELQLPWFTPAAEKQRRAADVLAELGLADVADSLVGGGGGGGGALAGLGLFRRDATDDETSRAGASSSSDVESAARSESEPRDKERAKATEKGRERSRGGGGVSGGERRRVAVAVELVASPGVLALDEPTSGLDASAATSMIFTLRHLASLGSGRVVVFSVHQPSPRAFRAADKVLLLAPGGRALWSGAPRECASAFRAAGVGCPEPLSTSPDDPDWYRVDISEWILEVASSKALRAKLRRAQAPSPAEDAAFSCVSGSPAFSVDGDALKASSAHERERRRQTDEKDERPRRWRSFATELRVLTRRAFRVLARDP